MASSTMSVSFARQETREGRDCHQRHTSHPEAGSTGSQAQLSRYLGLDKGALLGSLPGHLAPSAGLPGHHTAHIREVMMHTFNPSALEAEADLFEFEIISLGYRVGSRPGKAIHMKETRVVSE